LLKSQSKRASINARVGASSACAGERKPVSTAAANDVASSREAPVALAASAVARRNMPAEVLEGSGCFAERERNDRIRVFVLRNLSRHSAFYSTLAEKPRAYARDRNRILMVQTFQH
jgi:hypothetical protein